jgi:E3 ubiquitin-protein ligase MARCH6
MGMYVCWGSFSLGQNTRKRIIQYGRAARLRRSGASTRFKRAVFGYLNMAYSVIMLYFVLPLLVGINFELYVSVTTRYGFSSELTPVLHVWDAWAMGTALVSLYVGAVGFMGQDDRVAHDTPRGHRFREAFRRPMRQKFGSLNGFLLPLTVALVVPIVVPWMFFLSACMGLRLLGAPLPLLDAGWVFRVLYPVWSMVFIVAFTWQQIMIVLGHVRQWMIDAEYVLEERVENYEPEGDEEDDDDDDEAAARGTAKGQARDEPIGAETPVPALGERERDDEWEDMAEDLEDGA